jgi:hypothetical protein
MDSNTLGVRFYLASSFDLDRGRTAEPDRPRLLGGGVMADSDSDFEDEEVRRPLSCGLRGSCKSARQGLGFPSSEPDAQGTPRPYLPPDIVRLIDEPLRASERAEILRAMYEGDLGLTLTDAARAGGLRDTRFLLAAGADAGAENGHALYIACYEGYLPVAEALLDVGGTLTPEHRNVALHYAAGGGHTACCELLLDRGADVHYSDHAGDSLCYAARFGHVETVAFLLDRGADAWSERAMRNATRNHHNAVVALLLARREGGAAQ